MNDTISGKVAAVIDDTTLVLNLGRESGVREGMLFAIVSDHQDVADPDSGESLGKWEFVKARVLVTHVQEKMCTVRSPLAAGGGEETTGTLSAMMVRHSFGLYGSHKEARQSLAVRAGDVSGQATAKPVAIGDIARVISVAEEVAPEASSTIPPTSKSGDLPSTAYAQSADPVPAPEPAAGEGPPPPQPADS